MAKRAAAQAATEENQTETATTETTEASEPKSVKSIVPNKYAGKYKGGGSDALAEFIKAQCTTDNVFSFDAFFALARKNGLAEEKVAGYEQQVADKRHGSQGRARMTLRNMLATIARKNGVLVGLDDENHEVALPKLQASGAAAKAKADAAAKEAAE